MSGSNLSILPSVCCVCALSQSATSAPINHSSVFLLPYTPPSQAPFPSIKINPKLRYNEACPSTPVIAIMEGWAWRLTLVAAYDSLPQEICKCPLEHSGAPRSRSLAGLVLNSQFLQIEQNIPQSKLFLGKRRGRGGKELWEMLKERHLHFLYTKQFYHCSSNVNQGDKVRGWEKRKKGGNFMYFIISIIC